MNFSPKLQTHLVETSQKIHKVLFNVAASEVAVGVFGHFTSPRAADLHGDGDILGEEGVVYNSRIGALPINVIEGRWGTPMRGVFRMICSLPAGIGQTFLRKLNILKDFPVNEVVLFALGKKGSLHCSSPVPRGGAASAFLTCIQSLAL